MGNEEAYNTDSVTNVRTMRQWLLDNDIDEVEGIIPDMNGVARGKLIPAKKYREEVGMRLPEAVFLQSVTGEDPEDWSSVDPADIDIILKPDPNTLRVVPWAADPTALLIHDCFYANDEPVRMSPRYVLRNIIERYRQKGWKPVVAPELEFYLVKKNTDADYPLEPPVGRSGRPETGRQAFSIDAVNEFDPLFEDVYAYCEAQFIEIDTLIHEMGAAQMEVNLLHGDPLELADQAFLFKRTLREASLRHGMYGTFMGKPMEKQPGSAMHIHQSIVDLKTGDNIFSDSDGNETELFFAHIAGLQKYLPEVMALIAPNVNSYRRFTPDLSAPINVAWAYDNRTTGLRVPASNPEARRVENRVAGADANPYLAIAASLLCGYLGMVEKLTPSEPITGSAYDLVHELPTNLDDSIFRLRQNKVLRDILGEQFVSAYTAVKESEVRAFMHVISSWEREFLLLNV
ncbi:MAG: glutamine synthetase family protein [Arenicellales bacterium WSBS_2016_MAG_OTU3]